jgi:hypothetical protein
MVKNGYYESYVIFINYFPDYPETTNLILSFSASVAIGEMYSNNEESVIMLLEIVAFT